MTKERDQRLTLQLNDPVTVLAVGEKRHGRIIEIQQTRNLHERTARHLVLTDVHPDWFALETGLVEYGQPASLAPGHV